MNNTSITTFLGHHFLALRRVGAAAALLLLSFVARAQLVGDLDPSFNPGTGGDSRVFAIARQPDGKLVVGGQFYTFNGLARNRIVRLNADGSTDTTFVPGFGADSTVNGVALTPDGKVVIGGDFLSFNGLTRYRIARLNADGSLDSTFLPNLGTDGSVQAVAVQPDGKVLVAGGFSSVNGVARSRVARFNVDGSLDTSFDPGTGANGYCLGLALQPDGKVLLGGYFSAVNGVTRHRIARLNSDGSVDTAFTPGTLDNGYINGISLAPGGKILVAGGLYVGSNVRVLRLNADGSLDTGFNAGLGINSDVMSAIAQADGKVLIGGYFTTVNGLSRNGVARLNADGSLDASFNPGAGANHIVWTLLLQPDGLLVAGGSFTTYQGVSRNFITRILNSPVNQAPVMSVPAGLTILEDSGLATVTVTGIAPGPVSEIAQTVTNLFAISSDPGVIPHPVVTYTPGATTATLDFTPVANANGIVTISVVAQDNGGAVSGGVDRATNIFTVTVTPVNDAPGFALGSAAGMVTNRFVTGWGHNNNGQTDAPVGLSNVVSVAAGEQHSVALLSDSTVVSWGWNAFGQINVPAGLTNVVAVAAGWYHSLALKSDGTVVAWGSDSDGQSTVPGGLTDVVAIAGTFNGSLAVKSDGTVVYWGQSDFGAQSIPGGLSGVVAVAGGYHAVALKGDGTVVAWGYNDEGQADVPAGLANVTAIAATRLHTLALKADGTVVAWGYNGDGQTNVPVGLGDVVAIAAGGYHSLALKSDGTLVAWGKNNRGQTDVPVGLLNVTGVAAGAGDFSLAVSTTHIAYGLAVNEDSGLFTLPLAVKDIFTGPANESAQVVSFTVANDNNALFSSQPAISSAGTLTFTPAPNAAGSATVTVYAQDDGGTDNGGVNSAGPQTFTVTVNAVNDAPVINFAASSVVVVEDSGATNIVGFATVTAGPANESGQTITNFTVTTDNPTLFSAAPALTGGALSFTPAAGAIGSAVVTVTAQDDGGTANGGVNLTVRTFTITVTDLNYPPVITFASNVAVLQDSGAASLGGFATITTGPANESSQSITNLSVSNDNTALFSAQPALSGGTLTFTPALNAIGLATVTVIAQDNGGTDNGGVDKATNTFTISVIGVNHAPTFALRPVNTQSSLLNNGSFEAGSFTGWTATDTANSTPTLAVRTNGANLGFFNVVSSDGTYSATHGFSGATAGSISIAQDVTLPPGGGATLSFTYRAAWQTFGAAADRVFRFAVQPAGGGADLLSQTILTATPNSFVFQTASTPVTVDLSAFAGQTVRVVFVTDIAAGDAGNGSFQLDNVQLSATTPNFTVYENSGASSTLNFATNILAGPPGEAAQTVAFLVINNNNGLFSSQPAIAADGTLTFTPAPDANGTATVTVRAQDNGGTDNGGVDTSVAHTFAITLLPVNSAPRITVNTAELVVNEDRGAYSGAIATLTTGPADESGQSITNVVTGNNNNALFSVQPAVSTSGVLTFTPTANANGSAVVTFTAQDNGGTANGGVNQTTRTFTLTVTNVNDAPSFALPAGPPVAAGAVWTAQASGSRQWSRVVASADGTKLAAIYWGGLIHTSADSGATWTPQNNSGSRNWIGLASSADGTKLAAAVNGGGIYTSVDSGVTWTLQAAAGTRGWGNLGMSPDGSRLIASGYFIPAFGSTDGGVTWTQIQPARQWGPITISDNNLRVSMVETGGPIWTSLDFGTNWFTGTGTAGNLNPLAASADGTKLVTASAQFGTIYTSTNSGTNWTSRESVRTWIALASSADGSFLVAAVQNGLIYTSSDSGVTWTPQPGSGSRNWSSLAMSADGSKMFATDGSGFIYSSGAGFGPYVVTVLEDSGAYTGGANFATSISAGPADESTQVVDFLVSNDNNALFSVPPAVDASGTLTFTPAANAFGSATVTVRAHDDGGTDNGGVDTSAAQTFTLNVTDVNDAPSITLGTTTVTVNEDSGAYSGALATFVKGPANESSQSITTVTVTGNSNPGLFSVAPAVSTSGVLTFTPAANASGSATVTITAQDNGGTANGGVDTSDSVTFTLTVNSVNDAPSFALNGGVLNTGSGGGGGSGDGLIVGGATYYPAGGTTVLVAPDLTYSNSVSSTTAGAAVSIDNGQTGDALGFNSTLATSYGISGTYNTTTKVLSFTGSATTAQYQEVLRSVTYSNASGTPTTDRTISFNVGLNTLYNPINGHYYEYIASGLSWSDAKAAAAARTFNGMVGYLATVTSAAENEFIRTKLLATAWIGGSDDFAQINAAVGYTLYADQSASEGKWYWVTGPEAGQQFMLSNGSTAPGKYSNWGASEPNNAGGEHYPQFFTSGQWNDLPNSPTLAYVVEYGGQVGDPVQTLSLTGSRTLTYNPVLQVVENTGLNTFSLALTNISAGPADESAQLVDFIVSNNNGTLFTTPPAVAADGSLTFTLAANVFGSATVTVQAHDDGGTANGGVNTSAAKTFTITVTAVNDAPSFTLAGTNLAAFTADGAVTRANWLTSLSAGPGSESGQVVSLTVTNSDNAQFTVQPAIAADGTLTFTPAPGASGVVTVGVIAQDNGGTANGGVDTSAVRYFTISFATAKVFVSDAPTSGGAEVVIVPVSLAGVGTESAVGFTLTYDPTLLSFNSATAPAGLSVIASAASAGNGQVGIVVSQPAGGVFAAGTNLLVTVSFTTAALSTNATVAVDFSSAVAVKEVVAADASTVANVLYASGTVNITGGTHPGGTKEGDVSQRPTGNGSVTVADAIQIGRFAAGLDTVTNFGVNSEFQRADCAPLGSLGDGRITVADWVQALRFAGGLETPSDAGGPTLVSAGLAQTSPKLPAGTRVVRVAGGSLVAGRANTVTVQLDAQGNEAGVSLSLAFDPTALTFVSASVGSGARGGSLVVNSTKAGSGRVGLVLVMPAGSAVAAGSQDIITLTFTVSGSGSTAITVLGDAPVAREVADVNANPVGASFVGGTFNILLPAGLKAAGMERAADGSRRLVVRNADGSAVTAAQAGKYEVQVTSHLGGVWTVLPNALVVEHGALKIVDPGAGGAGLRLYKLVEKP